MSRQPLRPALDAAAEQLRRAGVPSPRADAEQLAAHLLGIERTRLGLVPVVEPGMLDTYHKMVDQRAERVPLQHITGVAAMGEIDVEVGEGVFVPRPETELLLGWALAFLSSAQLEGEQFDEAQRHPPVVLDLCTGSGALALAIAHARPDAAVHAIDVEPRALDWARHNARLRSVAGDTPITLYSGDATDPAVLAHLDRTVDLVVANPPYVPVGARLEPEVADYDPGSALFAGPDGLNVIEPLVPNIERWLRVGGAAAVEHDDTNGAAVAELFARRNSFDEVTEHPDLSGRPRFVVAHRVASSA